MKKCASCTKDLPDAALHCVFCGAKQPPAPAVQPGLAKTAFGYSANDVLEQVRQGRAAPPAAPYGAPPRTAPAPVPPMPPPVPAMPPGLPPMPPPRTTAPSAPLPGSTAAKPPYAGGPQGGFVPASGANAKTMFVQSGPPGPAILSQPGPGYPPGAPASAMAPTLVPPPVQQIAVPVQSAGAMSGRPMPPIMAIPAAQPPPYLASQTASRLIRPIEPWRDALRAWMFLGGLALLAAFATPLATAPDLQFNWNLILEGQGTARLPPLMLAAVGFLGVVLAMIPMPSLPRGLIAALLGLGGIAVPIALVGVPPWQTLAPMIGIVVLVPSLLVRNEYRDATFARLLVTAGAIGILLPFVVPQHGAIPLVSVFKQLIELPGSKKVEPALALGLITLVVMSLLAWLPAPVTGGAKVWAWLLILWALIVHAIHLALAGGVASAITGAPNATLVSWVAGGAAGAIGSAYLVIVGYGLATVIGKQLE